MQGQKLIDLFSVPEVPIKWQTKVLQRKLEQYRREGTGYNKSVVMSLETMWKGYQA